MTETNNQERKMPRETAGRNVVIERKGSLLILSIDLSTEGTPSSSGKTTILASTLGNADVPGAKGVKIGVNCFAYPGYTIGNEASR